MPRERRVGREELLHYYERELAYVRRMGAEFAQRYPKIAGRLQLEPTKCEDPHVERLIEAFAFLAARVHLKIDTGMERIGTHWYSAERLLATSLRVRNVEE